MNQKEIERWLRQASFLKSVPEPKGLPADFGAEVAFAGRSNAGKSSALNTISGVHQLARVSKTPGRTQHLVVFQLPGERRLIDLPGYGYAKVPPAMREAWGRAITEYFETRNALRALIIAMDIRHPLTEFDHMMLDFAGLRGLPVRILLTKADKLGRGAAGNTLQAVRKALSDQADRISVQLFSATAPTGVDEARAYVAEALA